MDQMTLNTWVKMKMDMGDFKTIEDVVSYYKLSRVFSKDQLSDIDILETRDIRVSSVSWMDDTYEVDEFGHVSVKGKPARLGSNLFSGRRYPCVRKIHKGKKRCYPVPRMMLIAFTGEKDPRSIWYKDDNPHYPLWLDNLSYKSYGLTKEKLKSMRVFEYESQEELDAHMWTHNLETLSDLSKYLDIPSNEVRLNGFKVRKVIRQPKLAEYSDSFDMGGHRFRVNKFGGVQIFDGLNWTNKYTPYMMGIVMVITYPDKNTGRRRHVRVGKMMARAYDGEENRVHVKPIDGNYRNMVYRNLWWNGCGRPRYFK